MANYKIVARAKPNLIRKREVVQNPSTIKIIINSRSSKTISGNKQQPQLQNNIKTRITPPKSSPAPQSAPRSSAVSTRHLTKQTKSRIAEARKKAARIEYVSKDVSADSLLRIKQIKGSGKNRICVIIGNGPSILDIDLGALKSRPNIDLFSINRPDPRVWPTPYWAFYDFSQLRRNEEIYNNYEGIIFNSTAIKRQRANSCQVKNIGGKGFSKDLLKGLYIGRSSVFATMQIAYWMGYEKIYIVGCDMNPSGKNGKLHFYGVNPDVDPSARRERFKKEAEHYDHAADLLDAVERMKFVFCSSDNEWSFVHKYSHLRHEECIEHIIRHSAMLEN